MENNKYANLILERREKLLIIKFNSPKKRNALNSATYEDITNILNNSAKDDKINVVAFTGIGDFYSSGNDLSASPLTSGGNFSMDEFRAKSKILIRDVVKALAEFPKLLIAVVNGPCFGIAATTAALCDIIYCSETAYFSTPFSKLGLCAEGCSSYTFPRILGKSKASEMLLVNYQLSAEEALKFNFVSEIFKINDINTKIWPKIEGFSTLPIGSIIATKELIKKFEKSDLEKAYLAEVDALGERYISDEFFEAVGNYMASKKSKL